MNFDYINKNYHELEDEINELSAKYGRCVTLVSVTKSGSDEELCALAEAGALNIGENRPGELRRRGDLLREKGFTPELHEIGNLQRNKVKLVAPVTAMIHSVDSKKLAEDISRHALQCGRKIPVVDQENITVTTRCCNLSEGCR
jgi:uncharacterized pyridoxal phosphate-containing UPF0001 family protein